MSGAEIDLLCHFLLQQHFCFGTLLFDESLDMIHEGSSGRPSECRVPMTGSRWGGIKGVAGLCSFGRVHATEVEPDGGRRCGQEGSEQLHHLHTGRGTPNGDMSNLEQSLLGYLLTIPRAEIQAGWPWCWHSLTLAVGSY